MHFLSGSSGHAMPCSSSSLRLAYTKAMTSVQNQSLPCYYVFNIGNDGGFVIVSGDDRTIPVLGYSGSGSFSVSDMPDNMRAWLDEYQRQIEWIANHQSVSSSLIARQSQQDREPISPMLQSKWDQDEPFNSKCPAYGSQNCYTGCVATAMAQLMYYYRYPARPMKDIPAYTTTRSGIAMPTIPVTDIDWDQMLPEYGNSASQEAKDAVANLMLMCGTSVQMDYGTTVSSAYSNSVPVALKEYFGYDASARLELRNDYSYNDWNDIIYNELSEGRPVIYSGLASGGGHEFVIDGYSSDDYFHVNWGWGGYCDNYFLLSILNPGSNTGIGASTSTDGYSFNQDAVLGLMPDAGGSEVLVMTTDNISASQTTYYRTATSGNFNRVSVNAAMYNLSGKTATFDIGLGLFDADDNMLSVEFNFRNNTLNNQQGWSSVTLQCSFGANLPDGLYKLAPVSRESGTSEWHANKGYKKNHIDAVIEGDTLTLQAPSVSLSGTMSIEGTAVVGKQAVLMATIHNIGTDFIGELTLMGDNNVIVGYRHLELAAGDSTTVELAFTPSQSGGMTLRLIYDNSVIATTSFIVEEAKTYNMSGALDVTNSSGYSFVYNRPVIKGTTMKLKGTLTNQSTYAYDDDVECCLYKVIPGTNTGEQVLKQTKLVYIEPGATVTSDFRFYDLEIGEQYFCLLNYRSGRIFMTAAATSPYVIEQEEPKFALDNSKKLSYLWFARNSRNEGIEAIELTPAVPQDGDSLLSMLTCNVFSTFMNDSPQLIITEADEDFVTPQLAFRSEGDLLASTDGTMLICSDTIVATLNPATGMVTLEKNATTMQMLNRAASYDCANALALPLCIKAMYKDQMYNVDYSNFVMRVVRPIDAEPSKPEVLTDVSDSDTLTFRLSELVNITDWRGMFLSQDEQIDSTGLYKFYNIQSIALSGRIEAPGFNVTYLPPEGMDSTTEYAGNTDFGSLQIENDGQEIGFYSIMMPLTVTYEWGVVEAMAEIVIEIQRLKPVLTVTGLSVEGDMIQGSEQMLTITMANSGADFQGSVYYHCEADSIGMLLVDRYEESIPFATETQHQLPIVFSRADTIRVWVSTSYDPQKELASTMVTIDPAATLAALSYTREYGEANPEFEFSADKGGYNGLPLISCDANETSPVGTYPIVITRGSVDNQYVTCQNGTLTITKAPLVITADSCWMRMGTETPLFTASYEGFKNSETDSVLTVLPLMTTEATAESGMGEYEISIGGAEAQNYEPTYVNGWLTVIGRPGDVNRDSYTNITDAVEIVQCILGQTSSVPALIDADLYEDGQITVADLVQDVHYIMVNDQPASRLAMPLANDGETAGRTAQVRMEPDSGGKIAVMLDNSMAVTAMQFDVTLPDGSSLSQVLLSDARKDGHTVVTRQMDDGSVRVLAYSMRNLPMHGTSGMLAMLSVNDMTGGDVMLSNIHVASVDGTDICLPDVALNTQTGIGTLFEDATFDIYDLNGRIVRSGATTTKGLARGIYIINNSKIVIK
ncbi:MAG: C10 family peptidase [Prevotella sp.]|nr:C10 family peptidase [Prevotella sp.]